MTSSLTLKGFLERNRISDQTWAAANIDWTILQKIAADHVAAQEKLSNSAELFARIIQKFDKVHSVRWRIKATEHLLEKIVRKRAENVEKYLSITPLNYFETVTDLVGVRALHLYKEDCLSIDPLIRGEWKIVETPIAYVRQGDPEIVQRQLEGQGFEVKDHPAGYRSVHYIVESQPTSRILKAEIQVRTIFEEGWSEIDHNIRYPNFSDNELVEYFLAIFNRMAGSADEMGGFVRGLAATLRQMEDEVATANGAKEVSVRQMEDALEQLDKANNKDKESTDSLEKLKAEVAKLKAQATAAMQAENSRTSTDNLGLLGVFSAADYIRKAGGLGLLGSQRASDALKRAGGLGLLSSQSASDALKRAGGLGLLSSQSASDALKRAGGLGLLSSQSTSDALKKAGASGPEPSKS